VTRLLALALIVPVAGCLDFDLDFDAPAIAVHSDGATLAISGCPHSGLLGCDTSAPGSMEVVIDGLRYAVPERTPGTLELFPSAAFQWVRPSPDSATLEAAFTGTDWIRFEEMNWFDVELTDPTAAPGHVRMTYTAIRDAEVSATLLSQCGTRQTSAAVTSPAPGILDVPLDAGQIGPCSHEVAVTQTLRPDNKIDAALTISRTVHQMFASGR
jgi:hypothetical protein